MTKKVLTFLLLISLSSCGIQKIFKAGPAEPSGFIENSDLLTEQRDHAPFHGLWFKDRDEFDRTRHKYKTIYFAPINTDYVLEKGWWDELNQVDRDEYCEDVKSIAEYTRAAFEKAFEEDPEKRFLVTQDPDDTTIIYEIAVTELIATKAHINAIAAAAGTVVPGGGLISVTAKGSIAIEVKVIDGESKDVIIAWADREEDPNTIFSFSDFSWYSHARGHIDTWAEQLLELHHVSTQDLVEDSLPFTLNPL